MAQHFQAVNFEMWHADVAEGIVSAGEGSVPDDFDAVIKASGSGASVSEWKAYVRAKMYRPPMHSKL